MFDIQLGYGKQIVNHWELIFKWIESDDSYGCPEDCKWGDEESDDGNGDDEKGDDDGEEANKEATPCPDHPEPDDDYFYFPAGESDYECRYDFVVVHVICDDDHENFEFELATPRRLSKDLRYSDSLGTFEDAKLVDIINACAGVPMPNMEQSEDCQTWVWNAMRDVLCSMAELEGDWEDTLDDCH